MENHSKKWFGVQLQDAIQKVGRKRLNLDLAPRALLIALGKFADKDGKCFPLETELEDASGVCAKNHHLYFKILKERGFVNITKKFRNYRGKNMTKNFYKINLNVVLNLSVDADGTLKVEQEPIKTSCSNDEPNLSSRDGSNNEPNLSSRFDPCAPNLPSRSIKLPNKDLLPNKALKDIAHSDENAHRDEKVTNISKFPNIVPFDEFWAAYPRKQDKQRAKKVWDRKRLNKSVDVIIADLVLRMTDVQWQSKEFIPHASTYLNGERWNDEIIDGQQNGAKQNGSGSIPKSGDIRGYVEQLARASTKAGDDSVLHSMSDYLGRKVD